MFRLRSLLARIVAVFRVFSGAPPCVAVHSPIGVLTRATNAHLDEADAFPVFPVSEGERLPTETDGRLGVRAGHSMLTLWE